MVRPGTQMLLQRMALARQQADWLVQPAPFAQRVVQRMENLSAQADGVYPSPHLPQPITSPNEASFVASGRASGIQRNVASTMPMPPASPKQVRAHHQSHTTISDIAQRQTTLGVPVVAQSSTLTFLPRTSGNNASNVQRVPTSIPPHTAGTDQNNIRATSLAQRNMATRSTIATPFVQRVQSLSGVPGAPALPVGQEIQRTTLPFSTTAALYRSSPSSARSLAQRSEHLEPATNPAALSNSKVSQQSAERPAQSLGPAAHQPVLATLSASTTANTSSPLAVQAMVQRSAPSVSAKNLVALSPVTQRAASVESFASANASAPSLPATLPLAQRSAQSTGATDSVAPLNLPTQQSTVLPGQPIAPTVQQLASTELSASATVNAPSVSAPQPLAQRSAQSVSTTGSSGPSSLLAQQSTVPAAQSTTPEIQRAKAGLSASVPSNKPGLSTTQPAAQRTVQPVSATDSSAPSSLPVQQSAVLSANPMTPEIHRAGAGLSASAPPNRPGLSTTQPAAQRTVQPVSATNMAAQLPATEQPGSVEVSQSTTPNESITVAAQSVAQRSVQAAQAMSTTNSSAQSNSPSQRFSESSAQPTTLGIQRAPADFSAAATSTNPNLPTTQPVSTTNLAASSPTPLQSRTVALSAPAASNESSLVAAQPSAQRSAQTMSVMGAVTPPSLPARPISPAIQRGQTDSSTIATPNAAVAYASAWPSDAPVAATNSAESINPSIQRASPVVAQPFTPTGSSVIQQMQATSTAPNVPNTLTAAVSEPSVHRSVVPTPQQSQMPLAAPMPPSVQRTQTVLAGPIAAPIQLTGSISQPIAQRSSLPTVSSAAALPTMPLQQASSMQTQTHAQPIAASIQRAQALPAQMGSIDPSISRQADSDVRSAERYRQLEAQPVSTQVRRSEAVSNKISSEPLRPASIVENTVAQGAIVQPVPSNPVRQSVENMLSSETDDYADIQSPEDEKNDRRLSQIMRMHSVKEAQEGTGYKIPKAQKPLGMSDEAYAENLQRKRQEKKQKSEAREAERWNKLSRQQKAIEIQRKGIKGRRSSVNVGGLSHKSIKVQRNNIDTSIKKGTEKSTAEDSTSKAIAAAESTVQRTQEPTSSRQKTQAKAIEQMDELPVEAKLSEPAFSAERSPSDNLQRLVSDVPPEKSSDSSIDFVAPTRPRPRKPKTIRRKEKSPIQSDSAEPAVASAQQGEIETEIGSLPSDLWDILDQPAPVQRQPIQDENIQEAVENSAEFMAPPLSEAAQIAPTKQSPVQRKSNQSEEAEPLSAEQSAELAIQRAIARAETPTESTDSDSIVQKKKR